MIHTDNPYQYGRVSGPQSERVVDVLDTVVTLRVVSKVDMGGTVDGHDGDIERDQEEKKDQTKERRRL